MNDTSKIRDYYTNSQWLYRIFTYNTSSLGMHYGYWDKKTKDRHQAMLNENQVIIDEGKIVNGMRVLDAGCGIGGTAIYVAKNTGARVNAITIVPNQVKLARKYAKYHGVNNLVEFDVQDYTKTRFKKDYFDVVYGIESICYSSPKSKFLNEAYRILKPGGRLVVVDGYSTRKPRNSIEKKVLRDFMKGFYLEEFITPKNMEGYIKKAGFKLIKSEDKFDQVKPMVEHYYKVSKIARPFIPFLKSVPLPWIKAIGDNYLSLFSGGRGMELGLITHYLHVGQKPLKKDIR